MSAIHEQAMNYVYQQVQQRLVGYFTRAERTALQLLIQRIVVAAGGMEQVGDYKVLVAHGGGEVSSYTLALLRAAQLSIAGRSPRTFQLRVATLCHAGMTQDTLDAIHRGYTRLFFHDDHRVELLMVDNEQVLPFNHQRPVSGRACETHQRNMLMVGHLTSGDIRATLCNETYLALGDFYQRVTAWKGGVHALVSGDSTRKQSQLLAWLKKAAQARGVSPPKGQPSSLNGLFKRMDEWSGDFYRDLYGEHYVPKADISSGGHRNLAYIGMADLLEGIERARAPLLTEFMGYTPDPLGFHFSHPAFANPLLMAHLRGLQAECLRELRYEEGVDEFLVLAREYLRRRHVPEELVTRAVNREERVVSSTYAQQFFGLDESQLTCLLFSPFIHHGERLEGYLRQCHPGMLVALPELHKMLQGKPAAEMLQQWVADASGLPLSLLQHLYRKRPMTLAPGGIRSGLTQRPMASGNIACQLSGR
ncbi:hypothetical protein N4P55_13850 [Pseudomonas fluorescens]|uniref:hypothetical protein n=1 Tax=Pseudomonas fluorescens TaxID=294 RepID=UPI0021D0ECD5|nr:hypothetical protein [Pseudomonas fluorescens]UXV22391.1 hypothetical protein N4P55_13850 [Pseudomonas fluorescens]